MKDNLFIKASVKNGELHFPIKATGTKYRKFLNQLPDDSKLEIFIGISGDKGSNPQLARLHAMIREIAYEIGYTFEEAKLTVKRTSGLCFVKNNINSCVLRQYSPIPLPLSQTIKALNSHPFVSKAICTSLYFRQSEKI